MCPSFLLGIKCPLKRFFTQPWDEWCDRPYLWELCTLLFSTSPLMAVQVLLCFHSSFVPGLVPLINWSYFKLLHSKPDSIVDQSFKVLGPSTSTFFFIILCPSDRIQLCFMTWLSCSWVWSKTLWLLNAHNFRWLPFCCYTMRT